MGVNRLEEFRGLVREQRRLHKLPTPQTDILRPTQPKLDPDSFYGRAHALHVSIKDMAEKLDSVRGSYSSVTSLRSLPLPEKEKIDFEVTSFLRTCGKGVDLLGDAIKVSATSGANREHILVQQGIAAVLVARLQNIASTFERMKIARLQNEAWISGNDDDVSIGDGDGQGSEDSLSAESAEFAGEDAVSSTSLAAETKASTDTDTRAANDANSPVNPAVDDGSDLLRGIETQRFEGENETLSQLVGAKAEQVQRAQKTIAEIAQLSQLFATKVVEQAQMIDTIYETVVEASEHIQMGNEQLTQAAERGVDYRIIVMVIMIVASFSLLFLHWYN